MLEGNVWIDETVIKVRKGDIERLPDGKEYRGTIQKPDAHRRGV